MRCDPEQIAATVAKAEQLLQHRKAGVLGREVRVDREGDRERTWGTGDKFTQTRDTGSSVGKNSRREIDC
jgi:hypothetical protein